MQSIYRIIVKTIPRSLVTAFFGSILSTGVHATAAIISVIINKGLITDTAVMVPTAVAPNENMLAIDRKSVV